MIRPADLPDTIAVFPLPRALLLPRAKLPLHLFEPRYLQMLDDCLKTSTRLIGMVQPYETDGNAPPGLRGIGCAGRLTAFSETEDGRYMITLTGISRFRVSDELDGFTPYRRCQVDWKGFDRDCGPAEHDDSMNRDQFFDLLERFFDAKGLSSDMENLSAADDELLINSLAMLCPFSVEDKQALLEAPTLVDRREVLVALMEFSLRDGGETPVQ